MLYLMHKEKTMPSIAITLHPGVIKSLTDNPDGIPRSAYIRQIIMERLVADGVELPPDALAPVVPGAHHSYKGKE